jgi:hypothetical protein
MPVGEYFKGRGEKVMRSMTSRHGAKRGKQIFYATANKRGMKPPSKAGLMRRARRGTR